MSKAPTKVALFQCPCGTAARQRWPRTARPECLAILVDAAVSSTNTSLSGSRPGWASNQAVPRFGAGESGSMTLKRPVVSPRLVLHASPVGDTGMDVRPGRIAALVLAVDPASRGRMDPGVVGEMLGLTPAESQVAVLLAQKATRRTRWRWRAVPGARGLTWWRSPTAAARRLRPVRTMCWCIRRAARAASGPMSARPFLPRCWSAWWRSAAPPRRGRVAVFEVLRTAEAQHVDRRGILTQ